MQTEEEAILLTGEQEIRLLYAANEEQGEKVMYYPLTVPFSTVSYTHLDVYKRQSLAGRPT